MTNAYMIGCEVGTASGDDRPLAVGTYTDGTLEVKLTKPGRFGTLRDLLAKYEVSTSDLPKYIQDALEFETTLQRLEYNSQRVASFAAADLQIKPSDPNNTELNDATLEKAEPGGKSPYLLKGKDKNTLTQYSVRKSDEGADAYVIGKTSYTFIVVAQYRRAFDLVPGLVGIKFLGFSISNIQTAEKLQAEVDIALREALGGSLPAKATTELQAQS